MNGNASVLQLLAWICVGGAVVILIGGLTGSDALIARDRSLLAIAVLIAAGVALHAAASAIRRRRP